YRVRGERQRTFRPLPAFTLWQRTFAITRLPAHRHQFKRLFPAGAGARPQVLDGETHTEWPATVSAPRAYWPRAGHRPFRRRPDGRQSRAEETPSGAATHAPMSWRTRGWSPGTGRRRSPALAAYQSPAHAR